MLGGNSPMPSPLGLAAGKMLSDGEQPRHMTDAHERAFRAMREALERVAEDAIQDDAVDDRVILPDETLTIVERALALAQAADSPTTEGT